MVLLISLIKSLVNLKNCFSRKKDKLKLVVFKNFIKSKIKFFFKLKKSRL